jgi:hypothetical protein
VTTSPGEAGSEPAQQTASRRLPTWPRFAVIVGVFVVAFVVARGCQDEQIKLTQDEAVAMATEQVSFTPEETQVRLLRQGLDRHPFWIISLSIPSADGNTYDELAVVRIDATSGEIVEFREQKDAKRGADEAP